VAFVNKWRAFITSFGSNNAPTRYICASLRDKMELNGNFTDNTTGKYRRLYANYLLILRKHGAYSKLMPKKILYAEAGDTV